MALGTAEEIWVRHFNVNDFSTIHEYRPPNPTFELRLNDVNTFNYDISLAEPTLQWGNIGPKRTGFEFWIGDFKLGSGIHSRLSTKIDEEVAHVEGKSWEWYLQNRHYPFDGRDGHVSDYLGGNATDKQGFEYINLADPATIINDLINKINAMPHAIQIYYSPESTGIQTGIQVSLGDTTSIFDFIQTMSEQQDGGFDWAIDTERRLFLYAPHIYLEGADTDPTQCGYVFDHFQHPQELFESEFDNAGPLGTHILASGAGTGATMQRGLIGD